MSVTAGLGSIGRWGFDRLSAVGRFGQFAAEMFHWLVVRTPPFGEVLVHAYKIGVQSMGIMVCILLFIGADTALVGYAIFKQFGGQDMLGIYVGTNTIIGLSPLLVGAMLGAKPGTEIAATIASMRVKEQIDALEVMAVNPYWWLIVPRFLAYLIVAPCLLVFAYGASLLGGYLAAVYQLGLNPGVFMADVVRFLSIADIWKGIIRVEIFAVIVCIECCFFGYYSRPGPAGVSQAINMFVVVGSISVIIINYFLTELMY